MTMVKCISILNAFGHLIEGKIYKAKYDEAWHGYWITGKDGRRLCYTEFHFKVVDTVYDNEEEI